MARVFIQDLSDYNKLEPFLVTIESLGFFSVFVLIFFSPMLLSHIEK